MSRRRSIALVVAVVALLAIVALAAVGRPLGKTGGSSGGLPPVFWSFVLTTGIIILVLMALAALAALYYMRRERMEMTLKPFHVRTIRSLAVVILVLTLVYLRGAWLYHLFHPHQAANTTPVTISPGTPPLGDGNPGSRTQFQWPEAVVVFGVLLAWGIVYVLRQRALRGLPRWFGAPPEELMVALDESLDDLRADPDLRRAIIAAYARMERALGAAGIARQPAEAPLEYLERALLSLDTSAGAVRRLTDLFEWARFSHHEPEPAMRDEAVDALVAVRDELRAREPVETW